MTSTTISSIPRQQQEEEAVVQEEVPWAWLKAVNDILINPPFKEPTSFPIELKPSWLFLSDLMSLSSTKRLMDLGITHVLTTNKMEASSHSLERLVNRFKRIGIIHCAVEGEDEVGYDMLGKHWQTCKEFILQAKHEFGERTKIVVHCAAGQNRSGLIVAATMLTLWKQPLIQKQEQMKQHDNEEQEKPTLLSVIQYLKAKRGIVLTNLSFQRQLCIFAAQHDCLGEKPKGYTDTPLSESNFILMKKNRYSNNNSDPFDFR